VTIIPPAERALRVYMDDRTGKAGRVDAPPDADVLVFQRITHRWIAAAIGWLRERGVAVVLDVDDDLAAIHPANPAFAAMHPRSPGEHSWLHLAAACRDATLVTVSTPQLLGRYAAHGRGLVLPNTLAGHYYEARHVDSEWLGWPATIQSHPDDPAAVGGAVRRLVDQGHRFRVIGDATDAGKAFGLAADPPGTGNVELLDWPQAIAAGIGVGLVPLASTRFNRSKSWLKGLELAACGVPFVASVTPEYERLARMGAGLLAEGPRAWERQLRRLLESPDAREAVAGRGRLVADQLALDRHVHLWAEAWQHALALQRAAGPRQPLVPPKGPPLDARRLALLQAWRAEDNSAAGLARRGR
jgi:hypothetical protein